MRRIKIMVVLTIVFSCSLSISKTKTFEDCAIYKSRHKFQICYPKKWLLEEVDVNYFIISNYDAEKRMVGELKRADLKIDIIVYSEFKKSLDEWLKEGDSIISQEAIYINGDKAYKVIWRSDMPDYKSLSVYYVKNDRAVWFTCYPFNTIHKDEFIKIVKSFRFIKEADNSK
ncbi:MAG: hypothetical protein AB2L13_03275 [Spirochaetota bacterium]